MIFDHIGLQVPSILLPAANIDMTRWAVIACDQYTSEPEYWENVRTLAGDKPSTLELIFPEVHLESAEKERIIADINAAMEKRLADGTLQEQKPGFVLLDRKTSVVPSRKGLIVALDLEHYDYNKGATSLIRATEGTILDRLPPRIAVRQNACIELPHILVLIDDPERTVIEPLFGQQRQTLYDFELMQNGGHLTGYKVDDEQSITQVASALSRLADPQRFAAKYGVDNQPPVLYAMGDGNHSFATAKAIWEKLKADSPDVTAVMNHPARYALVELINVHDPGLEFEAIHRVVFGADAPAMFAEMDTFFTAQGATFEHRSLSGPEELKALLEPTDDGIHRIPYVTKSGFGLISLKAPALTLTVANLQAFLDIYLKQHAGAGIDYIHGTETVTRLGSAPGNIGFYLPTISKHDLFKTVILDGTLPRKTFSMGEADEKRFYLECRRIKP